MRDKQHTFCLPSNSINESCETTLNVELLDTEDDVRSCSKVRAPDFVFPFLGFVEQTGKCSMTAAEGHTTVLISRTSRFLFGVLTRIVPNDVGCIGEMVPYAMGSPPSWARRAMRDPAGESYCGRAIGDIFVALSKIRREARTSQAA